MGEGKEGRREGGPAIPSSSASSGLIQGSSSNIPLSRKPQLSLTAKQNSECLVERDAGTLSESHLGSQGTCRDGEDSKECQSGPDTHRVP